MYEKFVLIFVFEFQYLVFFNTNKKVLKTYNKKVSKFNLAVFYRPSKNLFSKSRWYQMLKWQRQMATNESDYFLG